MTKGERFPRIKKLFAKLRGTAYGVGIVSSGVPFTRYQYDFNKGRGIEPIGAKDFKNYKIMYLTDPVINTNINIVARYIFKDGFGIVGPAEEDDIEKVKRFFDRNNFLMLGFSWLKSAKIFGTGYMEFPEPKEKLILRASDTMQVEVDVHGAIEKYIQKPTSDPKDWVIFEPDEIIALKNNPFGDSVYGISDLESVKYLISYMKDPAERDIVMMLNKYVGDRFKVKAGTSEKPYSKPKLTELSNFFKDLKQGEDIIFAGDIEVSGLGLEGHGLDFRQYLDYILMNLAIGMGVPAVFWIPQGSTEASARVSLRVFESNIRFYQRQMEGIINFEIIPQIIDADEDNTPKFKFNDINLDDLLLSARTDLIYSSQGIRSPNEIRKDRGLSENGEEPEVKKPAEPDDGVDGNLPGTTRGREVGINKKLTDREIEEAI